MIERQTAKKLRISEIVNGEFVKREGMEPSFVRTKGGEEVSRARILATIVSKFIAEDGNYASATLDDGSETLRVKVFSTTKPVDRFSVGDVVDVIGKVREYNGETYVIPEVVRKTEDMNYEILRRMELLQKDRNAGKSSDAKEDAEKAKKGGKGVSAFIEKDEEKRSLKSQILETIENSKDGISYSELVKSAEGEETEIEAAIDELLSEGICYEPTPGKIKKI